MKGRMVDMYCEDPACDGAYGIRVYVHPATMTEPEDLDQDSCPHCGSWISDAPPAGLDEEDD